MKRSISIENISFSLNCLYKKIVMSVILVEFTSENGK